jgi:hypothetical protein
VIYTCEKHQGKTPLTINHLKNEGQEGKTDSVQGWVLVGGRRVNGEGEGGRIWWMYFVYVCENRTMKPFEIVLRRGKDIEE